jgi:DNA repair exonuclease SbcCD ATPase subunit
LIDEDETSLSRTYKEVWRKDKSTGVKKLVSNTTNYKINNVPKSEKEYNSFIETICPEPIFKLLTTPLYFSEQMHWTKQREILFELVDNITYADIIKSNEKFSFVQDEIEKKTLEGFRKELKASLKLMNEKLETDLPVRIDETTLQRPAEKDFSSLKNKIEELEKQLNKKKEIKVNAVEQSKEEGRMQIEIQKRINNLKLKKEEVISSIEHLQNKDLFEAQSDKAQAESNLNTSKYLLAGLLDDISKLKEENSIKEQQKVSLREEWIKEKRTQFVFDESLTKCPTCGALFDPQKIYETEQKLKGEFNSARATKLNEINNKGKSISEMVNSNNVKIISKKSEVKDLETRINSLNKSIEAYDQKIKEFDKKDHLCIDENQEIAKINKDIELAEFELAKTQTKSISNSEIDIEISKLSSSIKELTNQLSDEKQIKESKEREQELRKEMKDLSLSIAEEEQKLDALKQIVEKRVKLLETNVNSLFDLAKFRLFKELVNGEKEEACEVTVNGVPFSTLNSAMKINAGLDIIRVLSAFYKISLPIFIDNRESISDIAKKVSDEFQIIHLFKVRNEKLTKVNVEPKLILSKN